MKDILQVEEAPESGRPGQDYLAEDPVKAIVGASVLQIEL